jgi:Uma2 family endonuclease
MAQYDEAQGMRQGTPAMPVSEATYLRLVKEDPDNRWELHDGCLMWKPGEMTVEHNEMGYRLVVQFVRQLDEDVYQIRPDSSRTRTEQGSYYIPDLFVVPVALVNRLKERPGTLEVYREPLPLVIEVWSPSTGRYDVNTKLLEYQRRGDAEVWRIHPYDRTLTAWRKQADGSYIESVHTGGTITPAALPGVTIDLDRLFA